MNLLETRQPRKHLYFSGYAYAQPFCLANVFLASYLSFPFMLPKVIFENGNINNAENRASCKWLWFGNLHTFLPKRQQCAFPPFWSADSSMFKISIWDCSLLAVYSTSNKCNLCSALKFCSFWGSVRCLCFLDSMSRRKSYIKSFVGVWEWVFSC